MKKYFVLMSVFTLGISACKKTETNAKFNENLRIKMSEAIDSSKKIYFLTASQKKYLNVQIMVLNRHMN